MFRGISLANKCLLLFGGAVVLIVLAALSGPWLRMTDLIDAGQLAVSREMMATWERLDEEERALQDERQGGLLPPLPSPSLRPIERGGILAQRFSISEIDRLAPTDDFLAHALAAFRNNPSLSDHQDAQWSGTTRLYRYARPERAHGPGGPHLTGLVVLRRPTLEAFRLLWINGVFLLGAGVAVLGLAMLVFYLITQRIILQPVRTLKETAERVREGNLAVRSDIKTGDEFEQLAETFNMMLTDLQTNQDRLRAMNLSMDVKLHEMAESNTNLHEATKLKGEFLASVSHELRTPLNSIIGFAELLLEQAKSEAQLPDAPPSVARRVRYLSNIDSAGRNLLTHINSLLEMARIEAGKVDVRIEPLNIRDACEGLLALIQPLADRRGVSLSLEVPDDIPNITTDVKKWQQIIFNFLSNAVKFSLPAEKSGREPRIILRAERLLPTRPGEDGGVRISVIDNGPGIPEEEQGRVFEKFHQLDQGHTREHTGTGLGLAICKELAVILQCQIQLESAVGRGSMFSLIMPSTLAPSGAQEGALEAKFRGALATGRDWN
ncbi:MAG: HAMP domain-containing histidine kinase [Planctomycetes bacterium]|nr:HAMP domain-containing histidine kinase [Planctomycetota bacterium]